MSAWRKGNSLVRMKGWCLTVILLFFCMLAVDGQQMSIDGFARLKRPLWKRSKVTVDKKLAILDLYTAEKGFQFTADGKTAVEAEEGEGVITLKVPHKTRFVTVKHPDFGQLVWRVPKKYLKKKKHYRATLDAYDPTKAYKVQKQWVVMNIQPENAIVRMDSTVRLLRQPTTTYYLPVGSHTYQVESPFYEAVTDSFQLTDSAKIELTVRLQPVYSYLTVRTPWPLMEIWVDGVQMGSREATSMRLSEGNHRLTLFYGEDCYYDKHISLGKAEKKVLELTARELRQSSLKKTSRMTVKQQPKEQPAEKREKVQAEAVAATVVKAPVTLKAADADTEIWVDRELVGSGTWSGMLTQGFHIISTRQDGQESPLSYLWVEDEFPVEVNLAVPQTGYGRLNIVSNVVGASVFIDGVCIGQTPIITEEMPAKHDYRVSISHKGYGEVTKVVTPKANDLVNVSVKLKKKK